MQQWAWRLASFVLVFGLWELMGRWPISPAFPAFSDTLLAFIQLTADGSFTKAYAETLPPLLTGLAIISVGGVCAGVLMGLSRGAEWLLLPLFVILQTAPLAAVVPIITYVYGIGFAAKVVAVVMLSAPLVVLNCYKGVRHTDPSLLQMTRSFLGSRRQEIQKIVLPQASPIIFAGLRLGVSGGFLGVILAEILITPTGIGDVITYNRSTLDYDKMYAGIASIIVLSTLSLALLKKIELRIFGAVAPTVEE
jgi:ABC-type nitrate/sulfonate/bicarbonate transport system permease component